MVQYPKFEDFRKNPLLYILFLGLVGTIIVTNMLLSEKDNSKEEIKIQLEKQVEKIDKRESKTDSLNHRYAELLGEKKVVDTLIK